MWAVLVVLAAAAWVLARYARQARPLDEYLGLLAAHVYAGLWHRVTTNGPAPWPATGPAILVSNHTCSTDPMFILYRSPRLVSWVVSREHYRASWVTGAVLDWMHCVPVTRGGHDPAAARGCLRRLREGRVVGLFPEGNLSGVARNRILPGRQGAAFLALLTRAPVYPVHIAGGPRTERLLQSWVIPSRRPAHVTYGPAVDLSAYYDRPLTRRLLEEVTTHLMDHIKALRPAPRKPPFSPTPGRSS